VPETQELLDTYSSVLQVQALILHQSIYQQNITQNKKLKKFSPMLLFLDPQQFMEWTIILWDYGTCKENFFIIIMS